MSFFMGHPLPVPHSVMPARNISLLIYPTGGIIIASNKKSILVLLQHDFIFLKKLFLNMETLS
jgi:hypothetical protein